MMEFGIMLLGAGALGCGLFIGVSGAYKGQYKGESSREAANEARNSGLCIFVPVFAIGLILTLISLVL